jgi:dephospho-CoA kinase
VVGLIGLPGAGKGECAKFAAALGITVINMGDLVRKHTKGMNLELTDDNIGTVAHSERLKNDFGIWATRTLDRIKGFNQSETELLLIDGIRGGAEVEVFREAFGEKFITIALKMPDEKRFELLKQRNRSDAPITKTEFEARDAREAKWGIADAISDTDYILLNIGTLEELKNSFEELINVIRN